MACRETKQTLSAYMDDELKPLARLRVEAHLRSCSRCRRRLRQTRRTTEMVRGLERVEAPVFAVRRAHSIAQGDRGGGWERLRGGLWPRPQRLPLKPVLLAGLGFLMVLVISQAFDTVVAPRMDRRTAVTTLRPATSSNETVAGLPGTLSAEQLSDSQKAEIARRILQAYPEQTAQLMQKPESPAAAEPPGDPSGAPAAALEAPPQETTIPGPARPEQNRLAQAAPETFQPLAREAEPVQVAGIPPSRQETSRAVVSQHFGGLPASPRTATPERTASTPRAAAADPGTPTSVGHRAPPEILDLGETFRQVLVLAQLDNGELHAAFHAVESDPSMSLRRFEPEDAAGTLEGEAFLRALEDLPPPEPDPDTGIAPPLAVYRPAPVWRQRGRRQRDLGPLSPALLRVHVQADGTVGSLALLSGSGLRWLDRALVEAVQAWEFRPAERLQQTVPVSIELLVEFELE